MRVHKRRAWISAEDLVSFWEGFAVFLSVLVHRFFCFQLLVYLLMWICFPNPVIPYATVWYLIRRRRKRRRRWKMVPWIGN